MTEGIDLKVTTPELAATMSSGRVDKMLARAPRSLFFHVRDAVGSMYGSHRREWLKRTQIKVGNLARRSFFYKVNPKEKAPPRGQRVDLAAIEATAYTKTEVGRALEFGETIVPKRGRYLAIPIGASLGPSGRKRRTWSTPARYRAREGKPLVAIEKGGKLILHQVRHRGRRRFLVPAYLLVPQVQIKPRLRFYATWAELAPDRVMRLSRALDRTVADAEAGREPA